ncbi:MAG: HEPN domain-containing protein [Planctomycetes bacterium]|nr:HEPN domain-containing protein [Planctomycetota bacterium]
MTAQRFDPDDPREWINRARSNLARARNVIPEAYLEDLCFDAQQAAEKAIKAVLIHRGVPFPYIHDLARLLALLEQDGEPIPDEIQEADQLTRYAVAARYPSFVEPVSEDQYRAALACAEAVVQWAEDRIRSATDG